MPRGVSIDSDRNLSIRAYEDSVLQGDQVRVRTTWAALKHGTEFTHFSGHGPFEGRRFDLRDRIFRALPTTERSRAGGFIGTTVVGEVVELGPEATGLECGELVFGGGPICETAVGDVRHWRRLGVLRPQQALCLDPASFAFGGIRDGRVQLGDRVGIFGLGAIGLLAVQLARLAGATVIGIDPVRRRREVAGALGAHLTLDPQSEDAAERIRAWAGAGVDVAIDMSGSYHALRDAIRACRQTARVVVVSFHTGTADRLDLGAEFFHNRLDLVASLPYAWENPDRDHPRWDHERALRQLGDWFQSGSLSTDGILDAVALEDVPERFVAAFRDPSTAVKLAVQFAHG